MDFPNVSLYHVHSMIRLLQCKKQKGGGDFTTPRLHLEVQNVQIMAVHSLIALSETFEIPSNAAMN
jgi:hypothetical protein